MGLAKGHSSGTGPDGKFLDQLVHSLLLKEVIKFPSGLQCLA